MKPLFDVRRFPGWWPKTIPIFLAFAFITAAAGGCGKSGGTQPQANTQAAQRSADAAPAQTPTPAPTPSPDAAPAPVTNPQPLPKSGNLTQVQMMNRALIGWMRQNHRRPQNFEDFASSANIQIPAPPPGKKYAFDARGFITLVDASTQ